MKKIFFIILIITSQIYSYEPLKNKKLCTEKNIEAYNFPARIETQASWDIIASASFIYWSFKQTGVDLGILTSKDKNIHYEKVLDYKTHYYPGFKAFLGTNFHYDNWNADIQYTRFHSREKQHQNTPIWSDGISFEPINLNTNFSSVKNKWKQELDFFDLDIGRPYYNGKNLTIKPSICAKGGWTKQSYLIKATTTENDHSIKLQSTSWFLGPQLAADLNWILTYNFRIFTNMQTALLYQKFENAYSYTIAPLESLIRNFQNNTIQITPNFNIKCGIGYSSYLDNNNWHIDFMIAYDFLYFWNQNEFTATQELRDYLTYHSSGDLMIDGIEISLKINF